MLDFNLFDSALNKPNNKALFQDLMDKSSLNALSNEDASQLMFLLNDINCSSSVDKTILSSDTYHTATSACSTNVLVDGAEHLMSDSGVEVRPSPQSQEDSDICSRDDIKGVMSDSQFTTSSTDNPYTVNVGQITRR
ncbi:hypothetical protein FQA39_LY04874 [Lamprigera yunnana]|nr:hypothetical protein FQA39_LY04874 [Lamprigera yunnana]